MRSQCGVVRCCEGGVLKFLVALNSLLHELGVLAYIRWLIASLGAYLVESVICDFFPKSNLGKVQ